MNTEYEQAESTSQITRGYLICIVATVLWSSTAIFIAYLTKTYQLPPLVLAFWRDLFLAITLGLVFAVFTPKWLRVDFRDLKFLFLYGFMLSLFNSLWTISVALNGAAVSTVLVYYSPAITAVLGWRLFGERLGGVKIAAIVLSILGCVLVSGAYNPATWQLNALGIITGLLSGFGFAGYSLMGKASSKRGINPWTVMVYTFGVAAIFILGYNFFYAWLPPGIASMNLFWLGNQWVGWLVLLILAVGPTVGGYGLYTVSLTYLPASVANLIATLEPAMTAVLAFLFLGEMLTIPQLVGSGLIIGGVVLLRVGESRS